ncbi:MAG: DUF4190 domain-containing protein [Planctomycetes bacterium]|nr:DUF4190 domain-containing protein [Planctomycetota bacterium]
MRDSYAPHRGVLILILGICSLVICGFLGPVAWIMGKNDIAQIDSGRMDPEGRGMTQAGMICGIIGTVFLIIGFLWVIAVFVFGFGATMVSNGG